MWVGKVSTLKSYCAYGLNSVKKVLVHRILIVDDERPIRSLLSTVLKRAGYDVQTAADGPEAITLCKSERFDLVLSDVIMPAMNGHELAQWIATNVPETRTALMSGYDLRCDNCSFSPRCELLPKPFMPSDAVKFVGNILAA